ncbi:MAG: MYG1 family protein [Ruthenibacterium lactatiformans]
MVYPSQRGGWAAQAVPASFGSPALKVPFPAHWAGASEQELPGLSGIETCGSATRGGSLSLRARRRTLWPRVRPRWS